VLRNSYEVTVVVASSICCEAVVDVVGCMLKPTTPTMVKSIVYANIKLEITDNSIRKLVLYYVVALPLPSASLLI